jgi:quercetin dioxygenase-like cupin family protein
MDVAANDRIVPPGEGVSRPFMPGEVFTWKTTGAATGGAMDFGELVLEPGVRVPEHIHHGNDEAYYILDGTYRFKVGDDVADASAGTFIFISRGTPHAWVNMSAYPGRVAVILTPAGMVPELMVGLTDMTKVDPAVLAKAEAIFQRYGYELVGPPLT